MFTLTALVTFAAAAGARADPLPEPDTTLEYELQVAQDHNTDDMQSFPGTGSLDADFTTSPGGATVSLHGKLETGGGLRPIAALQLQVGIDKKATNIGPRIIASAVLDYAFRVFEPVPGSSGFSGQVPVIVKTKGEISVDKNLSEGAASGSGRIDAKLATFQQLSPYAKIDTTKDYDGFDLTRKVVVDIDAPTSVLLSAQVNYQILTMAAGDISLTAVVDPEITIDPDFEYADHFAIEYSEGLVEAGGSDAGVSGGDAATGSDDDAGATGEDDAGAGSDPGDPEASDEGCSCRVAAPEGVTSAVFLLPILLAVCFRRRRC
jgi:MYXO-CTERM domain-containing protein